MALKKPSELFNDKPKKTVEAPEDFGELLPESFDAYKSNVKNIEVLNDFVSSFGTLKENIEKVNLLEEVLQTLKEELNQSITKEDLDNAMASNLLLLEKNIQKIEFNLKGINRKDLNHIEEEIGEIETKVLHVLEEEFPKFKKSLKSTEIFIKDKFYEYTNDVNERLINFESFIENSFEEIEQNLQSINENQLFDVTEAVLNVTEKVENQDEIIEEFKSKTRKQIFGVEKNIQEFYQKVQNTLHSYQKNQEDKISSLEESISLFGEDEVKKYQKLLQETRIQNDEKIQEFEKNLTEKYQHLSESVNLLIETTETKTVSLEETIQSKLTEIEDSVSKSQNTLEETSNDYKKLIKSVEAKGLLESQKFETFENSLSQFSNLLENLKFDLQNTQEEYTRKEDIDTLQSEFLKKLNLLETHISHKKIQIKERNQKLTEELQKISNQVQELDLKKYKVLKNKVSYIEEVFNKFNEKTLLKEGSSLLTGSEKEKTSDPLTPLDKKFVTFDDLSNHYRQFINRVQIQLASIGGGGAGFMYDLADVEFDQSSGDGKLLIYNQATSRWVGIASTALGGGGSVSADSTWSSNSIGVSTTKSVGIATTSAKSGVSLYVVGNAEFTGNLSVAGTITYDDVTNVDSVGVITAREDIIVQRNLFVSGITTLGANNGIGTVTIGIGNTALYVDGNARIVGVLTVGRSSVTIDGDNNTITSGIVTITNSQIILGSNVTLNAGATGINSAPNVIYVAKDGNDSNNGTSIDNAKLTIAGAVAIAQSGTTIKVLSGTYNENNPIEVPAFVSIVGDSLKTVTVIPSNSTQDIFYLNKGTYLAHMTFTGHVAPSAAVAFPPTVATNVGGGLWESPYVQNCTSNTTTGTGMRIDGNLAEGLKSMVVDSYTQYNQGGVGIAITNSGYAQLVSVFTICCNEGITAYKGGQCSLTNSNTDFGTYGLVADGTSSLQFTGTASTASSGTNTVTVAITTTSRPYEGQVAYFGTLYYTVNTITVTDGGSGYTSTPTVSIASPTGPNGITATAFATLNSGSVSEITVISSGTQYTEAPVITISAPDTGSTATATAVMSPIYYTINSSTPITSGITTVTLEENLNNTVSTGTTSYFYQLSRITASSHTFEYVGAGNDIATATPLRGGVAIQENEVVERNGGRVTFTSTDQAGNFRIGNDIVINQNNGTISGRAFTRSLFNQMTPFILALS